MEMEEIFDKLQAVADRYDELNELISDPEVIADSQRFESFQKKKEVYVKRLKNIINIKSHPKRLVMMKNMCKTNDDDLTALTKEELAEARKNKHS